MLKLIKIEISKLVRRKKFWIGIILLVILSIICTAIDISFIKDRGTTEGVIEFNKKYINTLEEEGKVKSENGEDSGMNELYQRLIDDQKEEIKHLEKMIDKSIPWRDRLRDDIRYSEQQIQKYNFTANMVEYYKSDILKKQYYLDNNIEYNFNNNINASTEISSIVCAMGYLGMLVIIAIMVADIVAGENKPATIKFMLVKPVQRWKIILAKFIASVLVINLIILVIEGMIYLVLGIIYNFGDMSLPILVGTKYEYTPEYLISGLKSVVIPIVGSTYLMNISKVILLVLVMQFFIITATIAFSLMCSTIINDNNLSLIISVIFIIGVNLIYNMKEKGVRNLIPTTISNKILAVLFPIYYQQNLIIKGDINKNLGVTFIDYKFGIAVLLTWIIVCYVLSTIVFTRKDIKA